jgi:hypothetical protein
MYNANTTTKKKRNPKKTKPFLTPPTMTYTNTPEED